MAGAMPEHNLLTLDYWQDSVSYEGKTVPSGTIGCEALNISDVLREKLAQASQETLRNWRSCSREAGQAAQNVPIAEP